MGVKASPEAALRPTLLSNKTPVWSRASHGSPVSYRHTVGATNPGQAIRPLLLERCTTCGELYGGPCLCLCKGLTCSACGVGRIHRPISCYYDETTDEIIHVPHFAALKRCDICGTRSRWEPVGHDS